MLELSGTSYLGLQTHPQYLQFLSDGLAKYGANNPVSRLNAFAAFAVFAEIEREIAQLLGCEQACLFSSGYLAGIAVGNLLRRWSRVHSWQLVYAGEIHPCLLPQSPLVPCEERQIEFAPGTWVALANSVDYLFGEPEPMLGSRLFRDAIWRIMDVSHSFFVWDHTALLERLAIARDATVFVGSLGKAVAFPAGFAAGPERFITELRQLPEFCAASPPPLAYAHAFLASSALRDRLRERLWQFLLWLEQNLEICRDICFPVYNLGVDDDELFGKLCALGYRLAYLPYPSPVSPRQLRMVVNANCSREQLGPLVEFLQMSKVVVRRREDVRRFYVHDRCQLQ